jgi:hypothetical protein
MNKKFVRMICKKCHKIFIPETYRERTTGTCNKEECYTPFTEVANLKFYEKDFNKYKFRCLKCDKIIYTNDITERLCEKCRGVNRKYYIV